MSGAVFGADGFVRRIDRVWLALLLLFAGLAMAVPGQAVDSLAFMLDAFFWLLPFLLLSVALAAWLKAAGADSLIAGVASRSATTAIVIASLAGAVSPFCSCGVVPLMAALLLARVPLAPVLAFCVASPLMDPEQFILMAATLGLPFTLTKTVAAMGLGLAAGFATHGLQRAGFFADPLKAAIGCGGCGSPALPEGSLRWAFWDEAPRRATFVAEARSTTLFLSKWLLLAFALESLMVAWIPASLVASTLGGDGWQAIPLAVVVGVPAYLNGFAAIPLIGELMAMGMAPGAAFTFLIAGGVTSLPAAMAVYAVVRRAVFFWYLAVALAGSLLVGVAVQTFLTATGSTF
ncbi:unnamed protein product [Ectocarpus fasciculatus]